MAHPLRQATLHALRASRPTGQALREALRIALDAPASILRTRLDAWDAHPNTPPAVGAALVDALDHEVGLSHPALWLCLSRHHPHGPDALRTELTAHNLPVAQLPPSPPRPVPVHGPHVHVVYPSNDDASHQVAEQLTMVLQTLTDGTDALGEGPRLYLWNDSQWPPSLLCIEPSVGALVVFLGTAKHLRTIDWNSAWARRLAADPYSRTMMAVRIPASATAEPLPAHNQDWRTVVWSDRPPIDPTAKELPMICGAVDVIASALWMLVEALAVRPPDRLPEQSITLPITIDHSAEARTSPPPPHVVRRGALFRRRDRTLHLPTTTATDILAPRFGAHGSTADVVLLDASTPEAGAPSIQPRVLLGDTTQLTANNGLWGPGRLTVHAARNNPEDILLAAHLVAARQAWLEWTVRSHQRTLPGHCPTPSPHALHLLQSARHDRRPMLLPEPAPTPFELRVMAELGLETAVVTASSVGPHRWLEGWTLYLLHVPPEGPDPGLPTGHHARAFRVLQQVFERAGSTVVLSPTLDSLSRADRRRPREAVVLAGLQRPGPRGYPAFVRRMAADHRPTFVVERNTVGAFQQSASNLPDAPHRQELVFAGHMHTPWQVARTILHNLWHRPEGLRGMLAKASDDRPE